MRELAALAALGGLVAGLCSVGGWLTGGDPLLLVEVASGSVASAWVARLVVDIWRQRPTVRFLSRAAAPARVGGVPCQVVPGLGRRALVSGWLRPQIYIGDQLLATLDRAELAGVLLHEEHHRRTRAPLRAAAIGALLAVLGWFGGVERIGRRRLTDLERAADEEAMRRGVSPAALASALLKVAPVGGPATASSYTASAEDRIASLLLRAQGLSEPARSLPIEWLAPVAAVVLLIACHLVIGVGVA